MAQIQVVPIELPNEPSKGIRFTHAEVISGFPAPFAILYYEKNNNPEPQGIPLDLDKGVFLDDLSRFSDKDKIFNMAPVLAEKVVNAISALEHESERDMPSAGGAWAGRWSSS